MFDAWAGTARVQLYPGTVYLCTAAPVAFPSQFISLLEYEHLHSVDTRRQQNGYSPRLYPIALANSVLAWVFRWSANDPGLGFVGDLGDCAAANLLEVIAPIGVKRAFGNARLSIQFVAA